MKRGKQDGGVTGEEAWYGVGLCSMLYWSLFRSCTLSISLSLLSSSVICLSLLLSLSLSLSVCSSLSQCCAGVRKLQQTTKNFLECFCVYVRVCACVAGCRLDDCCGGMTARMLALLWMMCLKTASLCSGLNLRSFHFCWFSTTRNVRNHF